MKKINRIVIEGRILADAKRNETARFTIIQESSDKKERLTLPIVMFPMEGRRIPWELLKKDTTVTVKGRLRDNLRFGAGRIELLASEIKKL